jgi:ABC-type bacteriocin/lantibiotic exporter with double-glycine peptidase domain
LGKLSHITRVLVTHQLQYLPFVDRIYVMHDGTIQASGTYQQVLIYQSMSNKRHHAIY